MKNFIVGGWRCGLDDKLRKRCHCEHCEPLVYMGDADAEMVRLQGELDVAYTAALLTKKEHVHHLMVAMSVELKAVLRTVAQGRCPKERAQRLLDSAETPWKWTSVNQTERSNLT